MSMFFPGEEEENDSSTFDSDDDEDSDDLMDDSETDEEEFKSTIQNKGNTLGFFFFLFELLNLIFFCLFCVTLFFKNVGKKREMKIKGNEEKNENKKKINRRMR